MDEDSTIPLDEQIRALPYFARVAFGARCARRMIPYAIIEKPSLSLDQIQRWKDWIEIYELCAAAVLDDRVRLTSDLPFQPDQFVEGGLVEEIVLASGQLVCTYGMIGFVRGILGNSKAILHPCDMQPILDDFNLLIQRSQQENWTDETPVPPAIFGPFWPDGLPEGWPSIWDYDERIVSYVEITYAYYPPKYPPFALDDPNFEQQLDINDRREDQSLFLGLIEYPLKKSLSFRFYPAITASLGALVSDDLDDRLSRSP